MGAKRRFSSPTHPFYNTSANRRIDSDNIDSQIDNPDIGDSHAEDPVDDLVDNEDVDNNFENDDEVEGEVDFRPPTKRRRISRRQDDDDVVEDEGEADDDWADDNTHQENEEDTEEGAESDEEKPTKKSKKGKEAQQLAKRKYAKTTKMNPNGRQVGRNLVHWGEPRDLQLLLIMYHEIHAANLDASSFWDKVIRRLHNDSFKTGQTVIQHLEKLRQRLFESGALVPPYNGRDNCPTISQEIRGIIKCPLKSSQGRGWREVGWDEDLVEDIDDKVPLNTSAVYPKSKYTASKPGLKKLRRLREDQKGYDTEKPLFQRKKHSLGSLILGRNGEPLPTLAPGYSVRQPSVSSYSKKNATRQNASSNRKGATSKNNNRRNATSDNESGDDEYSEEEQKPVAKLHGNKGHPQTGGKTFLNMGPGGKTIVGGILRNDRLVKPQAAAKDPNVEDSEDDSEDGDDESLEENRRFNAAPQRRPRQLNTMMSAPRGSGFGSAQSMYGYSLPSSNPYSQPATNGYMQQSPLMPGQDSMMMISDPESMYIDTRPRFTHEEGDMPPQDPTVYYRQNDGRSTSSMGNMDAQAQPGSDYYAYMQQAMANPHGQGNNMQMNPGYGGNGTPYPPSTSVMYRDPGIQVNTQPKVEESESGMDSSLPHLSFAALPPVPSPQARQNDEQDSQFATMFHGTLSSNEHQQMGGDVDHVPEYEQQQYNVNQSYFGYRPLSYDNETNHGYGHQMEFDDIEGDNDDGSDVSSSAEEA